jgi:hypothetical protein
VTAVYFIIVPTVWNGNISKKLWWGPGAGISCREFFKILGVLSLTAQCIYTITVFVFRNREYFMDNSELYNIKSRNNKTLFQSQSNLSAYQSGPRDAAIKIYNNLPTLIKLLSNSI